MATCPICREPSETVPSERDKMRHGFKCRTCGTYEVTIPEGMAALESVKQGDRMLAGLSAFIRAANERQEVPVLRLDSWEGFAFAHLHTSVNEKLRRLLDYVDGLTQCPGDKVEIDGSHDACKSHMSLACPSNVGGMPAG